MSVSDPSRARLIQLFAALAIAWAAFGLYPTGFNGGRGDDQRYLVAALEWWNQGAHAGTTHWALRHPLILSIVAAFRIDGASIEAMLLVPRFYGLVVVAMSVAAIQRLAGAGAAWLWLALFLTSPVAHEVATSTRPEMIELAFVVAGLALFCFANPDGRREKVMLAGTGAMLGLAIITRETAAIVVPLLFAKLCIDRRWAGAIALGGGLGAVIGLDWLWLMLETGDPLYRLHVDTAHTRIGSAHMDGRTFAGSPFFNLDLATRWIPAGPTRLHWAINPIVDLMIDPRFALIFVGWGIADWRWRPHHEAYRRLRTPLILLAIATYVTVCWIFVLRPQPRYFLLPIFSATVAVALLTNSAWHRDRHRIWAALLVSAIVGVGGFGIVSGLDRERHARQLLPYLQTHPGTYFTDEQMAGRLEYWMRQERSPSRLLSGPPPVGAVRIRPIRKDDATRPDQHWIIVDRVPAPPRAWWRKRPFKTVKPMLVERRLR